MPLDYRDAYRGKNCLIAGGLGFLGSNLAHRLLEWGARVHLVDALIPEQGGNRFNIQGIEERVAVTLADLRDCLAMRPLIPGRDFIFNFAGQTGRLDSMAAPHADLDLNCRSQLTLLEMCRQENPEATLVCASTRRIYGRPTYLPVDEEHPLRPVDVSGIHHVAGEMYHHLYHDHYGLKTVALRLTTTYGPRMLLRHPRQSFLAGFVRQALERGHIAIYGDGEQRRDLNEVEDVVDALLCAAVTPACRGRSFNLGHTEVVTLRRIAQYLTDIAPGLTYDLVPWPIERLRCEAGDCYADFTRFQEATGWKPQVRLYEGLERMITFYERYGSHYLSASPTAIRKAA